MATLFYLQMGKIDQEIKKTWFSKEFCRGEALSLSLAPPLSPSRSLQLNLQAHSLPFTPCRLHKMCLFRRNNFRHRPCA